MNGKFSLCSWLRWPSRREFLALTFLIIFVAIVEPAEPYDLIQGAVAAGVNAKDYRGDGIIVAIDTATERELPGRFWSESDLAELLDELRKLSPAKIAITKQYFDQGDSTGSVKLASSLADLPEKPAWEIDLNPNVARGMSPTAPTISAEAIIDQSQAIDPDITQFVLPSATAFRVRFVNSYTPYRYRTDEGVLPSTASFLAGDTEIPERNEFEVDSSYDPRTVPKLSAISLLNGTAPLSAIHGKNVVIAFTDRLGRDTIATPHDPYASRASVTLIAAQTLVDGPPVFIGWWPSFLVSVIAAFLWIVLRRPFGRWIALFAFVAVVLSPIILERHLVFQQTSNAMSLILLFGIGKVWQRGRAMIEVYRSAAEIKSQFLAQASHDLRQPIHAIGLLADRLSQTNLMSDQKEIVAKISWSVDNARRMFRALLDIAAIESGTLKKEIAPVSVNELLAEVDSQNALAAEQANVDLRLVPSDLIIKTDRALIGTMLQNLVSNSIRYSRDGKIVVGCRRKKKGVSFFVADNGRGISPDELEKVQHEFYRSANGSNLSSVNKGLGLAIVNRLAIILDVRFDLRSQLGRGTLASLHGLEIIQKPTGITTPNNYEKMPLSGIRVVIADDDRETLDSSVEVLGKWGCEVFAFTELPYSIPACDIVLSDFDFGFAGSLADRKGIASELEASGAALIIVSGHHPEQIREAMPSHTGLILTKPLRAAQLRSALMSLRSGIRGA